MIKVVDQEGIEFPYDNIVGNFPNKELYPKQDFSDIEDMKVYWFFEEDRLYEDLFVLEMFKHNTFQKKLVVGYLPYSRSDKPNERPIFMLKFIADKINSIGFNEVSICEPHSDMCLALINNSERLNVISSIYYELARSIKDFIVVYPDLGVMKRYSRKMDTKNKTICCIKERNKDGDIVSFDLLNLGNVDLKHKRFVIIDDLCSRGGTFIEILERLKKFEPIGIDLIVAHLEENVYSGKLLQHKGLSTIYTSNAIIRNKHNQCDGRKIYEVVDITELA